MSASHQHTFPLASCTLVSAHTSVKPLGCLHARISARITLAACILECLSRQHPSLANAALQLHLLRPLAVCMHQSTHHLGCLYACFNARITSFGCIACMLVRSAHSHLPWPFTFTLAATIGCMLPQHTYLPWPCWMFLVSPHLLPR